VLRIEPAARLAGTLRPPPDKSISHRAALLAAMSEGPVRIRNYLRSGDTASTVSAAHELGAAIEEHEPSARSADLVVRGVGLRGACEPAAPIDVGNAGTLLRLLPGWLAGQGRGRWTIDGDRSIRGRPVDRIAEPLAAMGARIECRNGRLPPLVVEGSRLAGIRYELTVASAQVKSCLLLAGLLATGETTIVERLPTRDHSEIMLDAAGVPLAVERSGRLAPATITVEPVDRLELEEIAVPGDFSSAAPLIVAATLISGSELLVKGVGVNPTRTGLLRLMERMGARIESQVSDSLDGEPVADLAVQHASLEAIVVDPAEVPLAIDELPLVALLGAFAEGRTVIRGAEELRHKESDRIATVVTALGALGASIEATADGLEVTGSGSLPGGTVDTAGDHRLVMLGAVAGLASSEGVEVRGFEVADVSYPGFLADLQALRERR
jgi:3-phosphoshikimate 1-carboxyvinyltransferase